MGGAAAHYFRDIALIFVAAVAGGLLARKFKQPLILGYVIGGILISPFTPGPSVSDPRGLELFAEIGVILLMFSIGIEFSVRDLLRVKWVAVLGGPLGVILSIALGAAVAIPLGWELKQGIVIGAVISVASTMVLARLLMDRGELRSDHGRVMMGITLVEDIVVVALTVALPAIAHLEPGKLSAVGITLLKAGLVLIPLGMAAAWLVPRFLARIAALHSQELFLIVILALCLGTAAITQAVGLSLALGAFVAGLVVSGSEYTREALGHLLPLRDAFVALFFVTLGMLIDPNVLMSNLPLLVVMVVLIIVGKFFIGLLVVKLFGYSIWTSALAAVGRTQIGEFSFVLVQVARQANLVGEDVYNATLAASLVTILGNAALVKYASEWLGNKRLHSTPMHAHEDDRLREWDGHIVVCGFGRMGGPAGTAFDTFSLPFMVIEIDPEVVRKARAKGIHCLYGDPVHRPVLEGAHTERAALVIVTLPEPDRAYLTVRNIREINPTVPILARAHRRVDFEALLLAGATRVVQPEVEASATLIGDSLLIAGVPTDQVEVYLRQYREAMKLAQSSPSLSPGSMPELKLIPIEKLSAAGKSLRDSKIREQFGLTVVAVRRASGENLFNPPATTVLNAGDQVQVLGLQNQLEEASGGS